MQRAAGSSSAVWALNLATLLVLSCLLVLTRRPDMDSLRRGLLGWSPQGITLALGFSALFGIGWHGYDESVGLRWMRASSHLWVASEPGRPVVLRLKPAIMSEGGVPGERGRLAIWFNDERLLETDIIWDRPIEQPLDYTLASIICVSRWPTAKPNYRPRTRACSGYPSAR